MVLVECPDDTCRQPAEVIDRWEFTSTDGPIEHIKTCCLDRHIYTVPTDSLRSAHGPRGHARLQTLPMEGPGA
jgi:hypothetical protein